MLSFNILIYQHEHDLGCHRDPAIDLHIPNWSGDGRSGNTCGPNHIIIMITIMIIIIIVIVIIMMMTMRKIEETPLTSKLVN